MNTDHSEDDFRFDMDEVERIERGGREALSNRRENLGDDARRLANRERVGGGARAAQSRTRRDADRGYADSRYENRGQSSRGEGSAPARRRRSEVLGPEPERYDDVHHRRPVQQQRSAQQRPAQQRPVQQQRSAQQRPAQQRPAQDYRRAQDYGSDAQRLANRVPAQKRPAQQPARQQRPAQQPARREPSYDPIDRDEIARMMEEDERTFAARRRRAAAEAQTRRARAARQYDPYEDERYTDEEYYDEDDYGTGYTGRGGSGGRGSSGGRGGSGGRRDRSGRGGYDDHDGRGRRPKKKRRALKAILVIVIILAILAVGGFIALKVWFSRGYQGEANVLTNSIDPNYDVWDDYISILVLGTDGTAGDVNGGDVDILVNINKNTGEIRMLSFYRDLYLADETGYTDKLTNIFRHGDSVSAINALNVNYDTRINEYVTMGWDNVSEAIDLLGGVEVNVPVEMIIDLNGYIENTALACGVEPEFVTEAGPQTLSGIQAVSFCRIRYTDVPGYSSGDFGRSERQREVLSALFQKAKGGSMLRLMNAARVIWPKIETSLSLNEVLGLIPVLKTMHLASTAGFPRSDGEVDHRCVGRAFGASVVYSSDTLSDISWIYEYLFDLPGYQPSDQARQYAAVVASEVS